MSYIKVDVLKIEDFSLMEKLCPFGSIIVNKENITIDPGCRLCGLCAKNGPSGAFELIKPEETPVDLKSWSGVAVFIEVEEDKIHPVSLELIGKGRELADKSGQPLLAILPGHKLTQFANNLQHYGIDTIVVYDHEVLDEFKIEPFTAVMEDFINHYKPGVILIGGTNLGRNLAPRTAARFQTGLTADCTILDISPEGELIQIRPAFGGNIMAQIKTPKHRPQFATVRYKIFSAPHRKEERSGKVEIRNLNKKALNSPVKVLAVELKEKVKHLEEATIIIAAGKGMGKADNLKMVNRLAELLGAEVAGTRPMIEGGFIDPRRQIGLSGRTVRPELIITCGISGSVQFAAGMKGSENIVAINSDPDAPIFKIAHVGIVGDVLEILPDLIGQLEEDQKRAAEGTCV